MPSSPLPRRAARARSCRRARRSTRAPANAAEAYHGPAIWKVADKDTTIYLFGTVHALPKDAAWFSGPVARAYDSVGRAGHRDPDGDAAGDAKAIAARALLPEGQSLRDADDPGRAA